MKREEESAGRLQGGEGGQRAALHREVRRRQLRSAAALVPLVGLTVFAWPPARLFVADGDPRAIWIDAATIFTGWFLLIVPTMLLARPLIRLSAEEDGLPARSRSAERAERAGSGTGER